MNTYTFVYQSNLIWRQWHGQRTQMAGWQMVKIHDIEKSHFKRYGSRLNMWFPLWLIATENDCLCQPTRASVRSTHNYRPDNELFRLTIINSMHATQFSTLDFFPFSLLLPPLLLLILLLLLLSNNLIYILCNQFAITSEQTKAMGRFGRQTAKKAEKRSRRNAFCDIKKNKTTATDWAKGKK